MVARASRGPGQGVKRKKSSERFADQRFVQGEKFSGRDRA
ncbi:hypothetical protein DB30_04564 [Enhygromyxa salina]|uniref:Uncharacterized protein n=1 Tax=Enhygromyxa salina TaxID=215803 RepID=A0A0C2D8U3_9BACT|nr:hypothetical protein DB30_04564 [Enhygromyxa salina]